MLKDLKPYFPNLDFDEPSHTYHVAGIAKKSVSKWIHGFVEEVDWDEKAFHVALKRGITKEEVLKEWKENNEESTERGHRVHAFGEGELLNPEIGQELAVCKFWEDLDSRYICVHKEIQMYHYEYVLAGTSDILLYDTQTDTYIIADYKTNKDLFKNFKGKRLLEPFFFLEDHPYNHYQIQLSFYQLMLEQTGIKVSERWVIWLKHDGTYQLFKTEDFTEDLKEYLLCA